MASTSVRCRVGDDISQSHDNFICWNVQNWVICAFSFFCSKFLADFLWKGHLKIAKCSVLPQQNWIFVSWELRAKVSSCLQAQSSPSLLSLCLWRFCARQQHTSTTKSLESFVCSVCVCNGLGSGLFWTNQQRSMTYMQKSKRTYSSVAWRTFRSPRERMTCVWKSKGTCSSAAWRTCRSPRERF